jgi:2-polyprenyl-6-methoxyphenol hydroxylase-like FAD-dependent oxidoreductase
MVAAYVLAGEFTKTKAHPEDAFHNYEQILRPFLNNKQKAAEGFVRSFAPKTRFGLLFRNQVTKALAIPGLARLTFGRSFLDRLESPNYSDG